VSTERSVDSPVPVLVPNTHGPAMGDQATGWGFQRLSSTMRRQRIRIPLCAGIMILLAVVAGADRELSELPVIVLAPLSVVLLGVVW
jgi:hypothetical protein